MGKNFLLTEIAMTPEKGQEMIDMPDSDNLIDRVYLVIHERSNIQNLTSNIFLMPGYSGTPLLKKLGIKEEMKVLGINLPADYFDLLQTDISTQFCKKNEAPDFVHLFVKDQKEFFKRMPQIKKRMHPSTIIWVSWYKKSSGIKTDVTEDVIRNYALANDLVDIKVCAVSEKWSGLKLVVPVNKRSQK